MKLNAGKDKTMIVSGSCTIDLQSPPLTVGGSVLKESVDLDILGVTFDSMMTFEKHLHSLPEQLLIGYVSCGSSAEYFMIGCSCGDAFAVLSCPFLSTVLQCGARLRIHTLNYWTV